MFNTIDGRRRTHSGITSSTSSPLIQSTDVLPHTLRKFRTLKAEKQTRVLNSTNERFHEERKIPDTECQINEVTLDEDSFRFSHWGVRR